MSLLNWNEQENIVLHCSSIHLRSRRRGPRIRVGGHFATTVSLRHGQLLQLRPRHDLGGDRQVG